MATLFIASALSLSYATQCPFQKTTASLLDMDVAQRKAPVALKAPRGSGVNTALNAALARDATLQTRVCSEFTVAQLNELVRAMWCYRSDDLNAIYQQNAADGRALRHDSLAAFEAEWTREEAALRDMPHLHDHVRDNKCAEAVMVFVHHLSSEAKERVKKAHTLPMLATEVKMAPKEVSVATPQWTNGASCQNGHAGTATDDCTTAVWAECAAAGSTACDTYATCVAVASAAKETLGDSCKDHDPTFGLACSQPKPGSQKVPATLSPQGVPWPEEVVWKGRGYGVYPFWSFGATPVSDITVGADITTHWSSSKNAELLEHAKCQMNLVGYGGGDVPCKHLFLGEIAYFYSTDEQFCCISGNKNNRQGFGPLTAPQRNWTQTLSYQGVGQLKTNFYDGPVKNYTLAFTFPPFNFWYYTDMEDRPIEQGEGCQVMPRTTNCNGPTYLWHDYDPANFNATAIPWSVFDVPSVCSSLDASASASYCLFP